MRKRIAVAVVSCLAINTGCSTTKPAQTVGRRPILVASTTSVPNKQKDAPVTKDGSYGKAVVAAASFVVEAEDYQSVDGKDELTSSTTFQVADVASNKEDIAYSLEQIESIALANNPALQAAGLLVQKAAGLRYQVGLAPNPTLGYFGQQIAAQGTDQHGVFVEQEFVRGNKLQLNRDVLSSTQSAQQWSVVVQQYRLLTDIRTGFFEALAAQQQLEIATSLVEWQNAESKWPKIVWELVKVVKSMCCNPKHC